MVSLDERVCAQGGCDGVGLGHLAWTDAFGQAWPTVERHLRQVLAARRVAPSDHDDLVQEVAARAIAAQVAFHCAADLVPWATTVLRRLHGRQLRNHEHVELVAARTNDRRAPDVAVEVTARLDLARVAEVVGSWPADARETLFGDEREGTRQTSAFYVRRHRLRAKLLAAIDGLAGLVPGLRRFQAMHGEQAGQLAAALLSPAAIACAALVFPFGLGPGDRASSPPVTATFVAARATAPAGPLPAAASSGTDGSTGAAAGRRSPAGAGAGAATAEQRAATRRPIHSPVTERVEVEATDNHPYVEIENNEEQEPFWCMTGLRFVPDTCVHNPAPAPPLPVGQP